MAFCSHCGNEIAEGTAFCAKCGQPVAAAQPAPVVEEPAPVVEEPAPVVEQPAPVAEEPAPSPFSQPIAGQAAPQQSYQAPQQPFAQQPYPGQMPPQQPYQAPNAYQAFNPADHTAEFDPEDIAKNKDRAIISYLGLAFLAPLLGAKHSPVSQFHAKQGGNLFLCEVALNIVTTILSAILTAISWRLIFVGTLISLVVNIAILVFAVMGIVYAATGKAKELPLIGSIRIIK